MTEIRVEKKNGNSWWLWLIGLLVLLVVVWFVWQMVDSGRQPVVTNDPAAVANPTTAAPTDTTGIVAVPAATSGTDSTATGGTPSGDRVIDAGVFASTGDKLALVGRDAVLTNVRVVRVVGPKTFTLASGSEELVVMLDEASSRGVGTQGQIDQGNTISLKGNFQLLQQGEISNISNSRFRDLTEQERETLGKTQVYLRATEFSKVN